MSNVLCEDMEWPKRLPDKEIIELFKRYREGDMEARKKIIVHNMRLVFTISKRYSIVGLTADDVFQIGMIGLMKAVDIFDWTREIPFAGLANKCIANEILMESKKSKKSFKEDSLETSKGEDITIEDTLSDSKDTVLDFEDELILNRILEILETMNKRDQRIVSLRCGLVGDEPLSEEEIAKEMQISRSYVSTLASRAINKIRNQLYEEGLIENLNVDSRNTFGLIRQKKNKKF